MVLNYGDVLILLILLILGHAMKSFAAGAPSPSNELLPSHTALGSLASNEVISRTFPALITGNIHSSRPYNASLAEIPGVWFSLCLNFNDLPPCEAHCRTKDTACQRAASSIARTCSPSWHSYLSVQSNTKPPKSDLSEWHTTIIVEGATGGPEVTTTEIYTSFSTANETFRKGGFGSPITTLTPVYALGSPILSVYTTTRETRLETYTHITGPTPSCKFTAVATMDPSDCGVCTLTGGTVNLYFWPPKTTSTSRNEESKTSNVARSTVLNGVTLVSPSVYISISTIYASNQCYQVGQRHTGTLVAMNPEDVSTERNVGGKAWALRYGQLNFNDLVGPPPASYYEEQPSCRLFGCPTIYYTQWNPTLVVPPKVRSIDPAWANCAFGLEGFYDPPISLTGQAAIVTAPSTTWDPPNLGASPYPTTPSNSPKKTLMPIRTLSSSFDPAHGLASIIHSIEAGNHPSTAATITTDVISSDAKVSMPLTSTVDPGSNPDLILDPHADTTEDSASYSASSGRHPQTHEQTGPSVSTSRDIINHLSSVTSHSPTTLGASARVAHVTSTTDLISLNSNSQFVVAGQTLAPGSQITLDGQNGIVTVAMLTSGSRTLIELDNTRTVPLEPAHGVQTSTPPNPELAFTTDPSGNYVLHGTTVQSGIPLTIGSGASKTTLSIKTVSGSPAIVIDGTLTEILGYVPSSSVRKSLSSSTVPTVIIDPTEAKAPPPAGKETSRASISDAARRRLWYPIMLLPITIFVYLW